MKTRWLIAATGMLVWVLNSCSSPGGADGGRALGNGYAPQAGLRGEAGTLTMKNIDAVLGNQRGGTSASEAFAVPKKERPGLATTFGRSIKSPMPPTGFERASTRPAGIDAIYYNDREGLKAMGVYPEGFALLAVPNSEKVSGYQTSAGGMLEWGIKGSFGFLSTFKETGWRGKGRRFVEGTHGGTYSIVLKNRCKCDLQVVLSVDGLDVVDGKPASVTKRGYVIPAGETLEVEGYRTGYNSVAAFQFSTVNNSYANLSRGDTRNVGVIGLAVYTPKGQDPWTWMPKEIKQREKANPFAAAP